MANHQLIHWFNHRFMRRLLTGVALFILSSGAFYLELARADGAREILMTALNQGWPRSLREVEGRLNPQRSYLLLLSRAPGANLDLRSADNFRHSLLATHPDNVGDIGHTAFGWSCPNLSVGPRMGFTSHTGERLGQAASMLKNGWGLNFLFSTFNDGTLLTPEENDERTILPNLGSSDVKLILLISEVADHDCESFYSFVRRFAEPDPVSGEIPRKQFGLNLNPYRFEGGGCGSTAVAALDSANFFAGASAFFWRRLAFTKRTLGYYPSKVIPPFVAPFSLVDLPRGSSVPFNRLEMMRWGPRPAEIAPPELSLIDPEMVFLFFNTVLRMTLEREQQAGRMSSTEMNTILLRARRKVNLRYYFDEPQGSHEGPSLQTIPIDENYDATAAQVVLHARTWLTARESGGLHAERVPWGNQLAIIVQSDERAK